MIKYKTDFDANISKFYIRVQTPWGAFDTAKERNLIDKFIGAPMGSVVYFNTIDSARAWAKIRGLEEAA